jgi:hypothetical protein
LQGDADPWIENTRPSIDQRIIADVPGGDTPAPRQGIVLGRDQDHFQRVCRLESNQLTVAAVSLER